MNTYIFTATPLCVHTRKDLIIRRDGENEGLETLTARETIPEGNGRTFQYHYKGTMTINTLYEYLTDINLNLLRQKELCMYVYIV